MGFGLVGINMRNFYKCSSHNQQKMKELQGKMAQKLTEKAVDHVSKNPELIVQAAQKSGQMVLWSNNT